MNNMGKITPSLVDPKLIKEMLLQKAILAQQVQQAPSTINILMPNTPSFFTSSLKSLKSFLYSYGIILFFISAIIIYTWRRYIWYKKVKEEKEVKIINEQFINPGKYVCNEDEVKILQRPIPQYKEEDINKEVRNMYLEKINEKKLRCSQSLPTQIRVSDLKYNDSRFNNDRLDNIYGQHIYECQDQLYEAPIRRQTPMCSDAPIGRNAPVTPYIPDDIMYQDFYNSENSAY